MAIQNSKFLVVGLGNPGEKYKTTRHNIGRIVIKQLQEYYKNANAQDLILSDTGADYFMNQSGEWAEKSIHYAKIAIKNFWVIHDDLDIPFGTIRIRFGGNSAGHNGIQSIIDKLKTDQFWRFRVGIGRPPENVVAEKFVLQKFTSEELKKIPAIVDQTKEIVIQSIISNNPQEKTVNLQ